ncbi:SPFH domain-containing protein [Streptomyces sp. NPDC048018]|uniref:SPFH domain-containing protein n=1 Tax=Streptomyces sp. NPDC048018 TaxID=3365499 RepID=UPI00371EA48D
MRPAGDPAVRPGAATAPATAAPVATDARNAGSAAPQQAAGAGSAAPQRVPGTASGLAAAPQQVPGAGSAAPQQVPGAGSAAPQRVPGTASGPAADPQVPSAAAAAAPRTQPPGPAHGATIAAPTVGSAAAPEPGSPVGAPAPAGPGGSPVGSAPARGAAAGAPTAPGAGPRTVPSGLTPGTEAARDLGPRADSAAPTAGSDAARQPGSPGGAPGLARPGTAATTRAASADPHAVAHAEAASPRPAGPDAASSGPGAVPAAPGEASATRTAGPDAAAPAAAGSGGSPQQARPGLRPATPGASRTGTAAVGPVPSGAAPQSGPRATSPGLTRPGTTPGDAAARAAAATASTAAPGPTASGSATAAPAGSGAPRGARPGDAPGARAAVPPGAAAGPGTDPPGAPATKGAAPASSAAGARATAAAPGRDGAVDPRWIAGGRVRSVAVPVAASVEVVPRGGKADGATDAPGKPHVSTEPNPDPNPHAGPKAGTSPSTNLGNNPGNVSNGSARRRNVIGAETTGSIPVHLLFRDEPDGADDGGPATVPVPKLSGAPGASKMAARKGKGGTSGPRPARHAAASARPAPTADPKLVERSGPVLPGWVGVAGGLLALAGCAALVWWTGAVPAEVTRMLHVPARPYHGIHLWQWALLALGVVLTLFFLGGLGRGRVGYALVLTLFGEYRGTVRRTGLLWVSPLLLRRRVDVRLRHWRSEPLPAVDAKGTALDVVVLVVWRIRDTVRAVLGVDRHEEYLREQVEAAMARVLSQLPADAFHEDAPTLRDSEAVGEALTRLLSAECAPVGIDVFSVQPTRIEYAPEVAAAMQRRRIAAIDAKHRDSVLTSVVDAVDDVVHRLTSRGLVELDDYERKALVKDLTVAFYTGRTAPVEGA